MERIPALFRQDIHQQATVTQIGPMLPVSQIGQILPRAQGVLQYKADPIGARTAWSWKSPYLSILRMEQQSKQQIREHILAQIPDVIRTLLETVGSQTIRILGDTPNSVLDSADYQESIRPFTATVEAAIRDTSPDAQVRLLAIAIYPRRHSYFVLDVNNTSYDYETAHHDTSPLPVYVLRLSRKPTVFRKTGLDRTLATRITGLHRLHGMDPLPFFDDHNQVLQYCNPRSLHTLSSFQGLRSSSSSDV